MDPLKGEHRDEEASGFGATGQSGSELRIRMSASLVVIAFFVATLCDAIPTVAEEVNLTGKWVGTWSTRSSRGQFRGSFVLNVVQTEKELSGKVAVGDRPTPPRSFEAPLSGKTDGTNVSFR